ncbi:cysteine hydrolase [Paenibacillus sp. PK3_47]|uniref:cysteine hydrolase family protein n=1 Tax=Paenibacillus sp. PK3_47 TaxID=2072642 RepID=UPI00201D5AE7|nr:isochorismatase family cysteine hydrolase [Paenibacillus sp. PK3_47]UQZ34979.1 cysteine hydrolase [Paenibacillus sp. PK3_47]
MELTADLIMPERTALIIVDVQNDYCHPEGALASAGNDVTAVKEMMPRLHGLIAAARAHSVPIIYIQTFHERATDSQVWVSRSGRGSLGVCRRGSWGAEFFEVAPLPDEIVVNKHRYSAFINTRLDSVLRTLRVETLIMTGVSTNVCVESTARDGFMRDYHIVLAEDACASYSRAAHEMTVENMKGYFGVVSKAAEVEENWSIWSQSALQNIL